MASSYSNVNPITDQFLNNWGPNGDMNFFDFTRQSLSSSGAMDPMSIISNFEGAAPGLMSMAMDASNPYVSAIDEYTRALVPEAVQSSLAPYSADNSVYSSGAVGAATRAAGTIGLQGQMAKLQAQTGLVGSLLTGGLSALTQGQTNQAGLLSGMLDAGSDFATPVLQEQENPWATGLGMGISLLGALTGTGIGGGIGGLFSQLANLGGGGLSFDKKSKGGR